MASCSTYLQALGYIALLCFFVPIKIEGPDEVKTQFEEYLKNFNKTYEDPTLYQTRLQAFKQSLEIINTYNSNNNKTNASAHYGLTKFSDMLPEEFLDSHLQANLSHRLSKAKQHHHSHEHKRYVSELPLKVDWRQKGVVTKVHNQGKCGACWAYSTVETMESMSAIKYGKLEDLSVQQIIDCAGNGNNGCEGGDTCSLLEWMQNANFTVKRSREYAKERNDCQGNSTNGVQLQDYYCASLVDNEDVIMEFLVRNGPVAVAINAQTWQNYIGGVIEYHCDGDVANLNHAVQIVGYDLTAKIPHYIVRNTWGQDFGDGGYLYIAVEKNMCGLANEVSALRIL